MCSLVLRFPLTAHLPAAGWRIPKRCDPKSQLRCRRLIVVSWNVVSVPPHGSATEKVYSNKYTATGLRPGRKHFWVIVRSDTGDTDPLDSQEQWCISEDRCKRKNSWWHWRKMGALIHKTVNQAQAPSVALGIITNLFCTSGPHLGNRNKNTSCPIPSICGQSLQDQASFFCVYV